MRNSVGCALLGAIVVGASAPSLLLAGCSTTNTDQTEALLIASEKLATNYIRLPLCTAATRPICSDADTSAKIKQADQAAYDAFKAWQKSPSNTTQAAVLSALSALSAAVPSLAAPAKP